MQMISNLIPTLTTYAACNLSLDKGGLNWAAEFSIWGHLQVKYAGRLFKLEWGVCEVLYGIPEASLGHPWWHLKGHKGAAHINNVLSNSVLSTPGTHRMAWVRMQLKEMPRHGMASILIIGKEIWIQAKCSTSRSVIDSIEIWLIYSTTIWK